MCNPLVSIIIPTYNAAKYIGDTVQSALDQTWENKEIIIVDDGSTDETELILKSFGNKISYIKQNNCGASNARNTGIEQSKGQFIQFLDADDLLSPGKIETQMHSLKHFQNHVAFCDTVHFFDGTNHLLEDANLDDAKFMISTNNPADYLIRIYGGYNNTGGMVQPNAWLVPTHIIKKAGFWDSRLSVDDDGEYFCRVLLASSGIRYVPDVKNYYRKYKNGANLSSLTTKSAMESIFLAAQKKQGHLEQYVDKALLIKTFNKIYYDIAIKSYPRYNFITKQALKKIDKNYPYKYEITVGGKLINFISNHIHWKFSRYLQYIKAKLINRFYPN